MNFRFKLSRRLARMKVGVVFAAALALACQLASAGPEVVRVERIDVTPTRLTLMPSQSAELIVVSSTGRGDTVPASMLQWRTTGGVITNNFTVAGVRHVTYQSPQQPGDYAFIVTATSGFPADTALINVTTTVVPVYGVTVMPGSATLVVGDTTTLHAILTDSTGAVMVGRAIDWTTSDAGVATVLITGLVRAISAGTVTITATSEGHSGTAVVTVNPAP